MSVGFSAKKFYLAILFLTGVILQSCQSSAWTLITSYPHPHAPAFVSIAFENSSRGWGLTTSQLLKTEDGGRTWSEQLSDETKTFYALKFVNGSTGFIAGAQRLSNGNAPLILRTNDGGKTWLESSVGVSVGEQKSVGFQSIDFIDERVGWVAGFGLIAHTINGGDSWEIQRDVRDSQMLFGVNALTPQVALAVGNNGVVLRTTDGGRNWIQEEPVNSENLLRIRTFGEVTWILGSNGTALQSTDRGETWQKAPVNTREDLMDIYLNGTDAWIVGTRGLILRRNSKGVWLREYAPADTDLITVFFLNGEGWIGGARQTLLRHRR